MPWQPQHQRIELRLLADLGGFNSPPGLLFTEGPGFLLLDTQTESLHACQSILRTGPTDVKLSIPVAQRHYSLAADRPH